MSLVRQKISELVSATKVGRDRVLSFVIAIVVAATLMTPQSEALATESTPGIETTADGRRIVKLLELCTASDTTNCDSYIDGFLDGYWLSNTHSFELSTSGSKTGKREKNGLSATRMADRVFRNGICLPDGVLLRELRGVLVRHLIANQEAWKNTWYQTQLWKAFKTEYPCVVDTEQNTDTR